MAINTHERTNILKLTVGLFNAAPGANYLSEFTSVFEANGHNYGALALTLGTTGAFNSLYPNFQTASEFAAKFLATLGLQGNTEAVDFVTAKFNAGVPKAQIIYDALVALDASTSAEFADARAILDNKAAVAENYSVTLGASSTSLATLQGAVANVTADAASVTAVNAANAGGNGQTFTLTKGLDNLTGTAGNDTFIGSVAADVELKTLSALDSIDGGAGVDTLKAVTDGAAIALGTLKNVEIIEAQSSAALTIDASSAVGVTNLNVTKAGAAVNATAAATTDVSVKLDAPALLPVIVNGGNNANVTLTGAGAGGTLNAITVGNTKAAQGDVTVSETNAAAVKGTNIVAATTNITGGKTVTVTQKAGDASGLVADGVTTTTHAQNAVTVNANAATTTVTVKQDKTVAADAGKVAVTGVAEVATVKFTALAALGTATVSGLTFTASKALTAAEVAQAFANLSASALKPGGAVGDTQGAGIAANGVFTGSLLAGWNSGAAAGDTVTFTASNGGAMATDLVATNATATTTTQGVTAVVAKAATLGVTAGAVNIVGGAALKTVTVDGYNAAGNGISGTANALETLSLSNGGAFNAAVGAATVNLSLENVWAAAAVAATSSTAAIPAVAAAVSVGSATTTTLNVKNTGANAVTLTSGAATLNVSGSGLLSAANSALAAAKTIKVTETAGLNLTGATLTALESVDTTGTTGTVTVAIDGTKATYAGGAGSDSVTVSNNAAITKAINLGAGDDRLDLKALNTASLNGIAATNVLEGGDGTDALVLDAAAADSTTGVSGAATFATRINGFEKLGLTAVAAATTVNLENLDSINYVVSNGSGAFAYKLDKMLNNATVELKAAHTNGIEVALKDATGTADVVNLIANADTGTNIGTVTVAGVETLNITANDTDVSTTVAVSTNTLTLKADTAATVNVTGAGNLVLALDAASVKVASVDASTATGALTLDLATQSSGVAVTVKGGAGKDVLKASISAAAKADVLQGGAGDDTLHAGSNGAVLTGGAGNDLFVLGAGTKEANTYTSIADFQAGDLLQLTGATTFAKLTATLNPATAVFSDYVNAAMGQAELVAGAGDAVWFSFGGNSYVMLENNATVGFNNGADSIVQLTGVANLDTASFNGSFVTVSL